MQSPRVPEAGRPVAHHGSAKIIATVGPACSSVDALRGLIRAGADCFRINFSHGDGPSLAPLMTAVREASRLEAVPIALLADIQGPKLRVGRLPDEGVLLVEERRVILVPEGRSAAPAEEREGVLGSPVRIPCRYDGLLRDVAPGSRVLLADGTIELEVEAVRELEVMCRVVTGGRLFSNKGINVPGSSLSVDALTEKDRRDLAYLASTDVDIVAVSFVRTAEDIRRARALLDEGAKVPVGQSARSAAPANKPVIAKLERLEAMHNLDEILDASDGVMVARGDLGVELPFERVPLLQKHILARATAAGKWAVVATQMLGSMVRAPRPTRAEASDVLNAVLDGADAVMLSEETAVGAYPADAVSAMDAIARTAEELERQTASPGDGADLTAAAASAAVHAAERVQARAIVVLSGGELAALFVSKHRSRLPTLALSSKLSTLRRLNVLRGVRPVEITERADLTTQLAAADRALLDTSLASVGEPVVVLAAAPLGARELTDTLSFHRVQAAD